MQKALATWFLLAMAPVAPMGPTEALQAALQQVAQVLEEQSGARAIERRRAELRRIAERMFDYHEMARRSLGRHWTDRTPQQRDEFVLAFRELVERAYMARVEQMAGEPVVWGPESVDGDTATVRSRIKTGVRSEVALSYRLHLLGARWAVYDITMDGISLISSYRSQFARIIQSSSYEELLRRLRSRETVATTIEPAAAAR